MEGASARLGQVGQQPGSSWGVTTQSPKMKNLHGPWEPSAAWCLPKHLEESMEPAGWEEAANIIRYSQEAGIEEEASDRPQTELVSVFCKCIIIPTALLEL